MKGIVVSAIAGALLAAGSVAQAKEFRVYTSAPPKTPWGANLASFGTALEKNSGGKLTAKIFYSAQLGDEQEATRQTARGRIDIAGLSNTAASLLVPEFALLAAPYLWQSSKQGDCVIDKHAAKIFASMFEARGVVPLAWVEVGHQIVFSTFPVKVPADLGGKKIRTAPVKTDTLYMNAAGATAVPLGVADAMPALKTGGVAAATWPIVYGVAVGYHKVARHVTVTAHSHQTGGYFVSKRVWDKLSKAERELMQKTADETIGTLRGAIRKAEAGLLKKAAAEGGEVFTPDGTYEKAWRALASNVHESVVKETGGRAAEVWSKIQAAKQACGG